MKTRPIKLSILAVCLLVLAAAIPAQLMAMYGHSPREWMQVLAEIAPLNWAIIVAAPLTAVLAYRASPWLVAALPLLTGLVLYNNWLVGVVGENASPLMTWFASLGFVAGLSLAMSRDSLYAVLHPELRWWLTPMRRQVQLPVRLKLVGRSRLPRRSHSVHDEFYIRTYDISEGGAFIPVDQSSVVGVDTHKMEICRTVLKNLPIGTQCYVCLPLRDVQMLQCRAEVVRTSTGQGGYPAGVGIRFLGLSRVERRRLTHYLERAA